jgi:MFS family permease
MDKLLSPFRQSKLLNRLFLSNIFLSLHYALIIYINSSYLAQFFSETQISALYIIGAVINTILLISASRILESIGVYRFIIYTLAIEFLATLGMVLSASPFLIGLYFLVHSIAISLIYFNMDVFVENASSDESKTGSIRATYLTMANLTIVFAHALVAILLIHNIYTYVYIASAIFLVPMYYLAKKLKSVGIKSRKHIRVMETFAEYIRNKNLYNIFISNFLLQMFYAFMVVYMPMYLSKYIGFSWAKIGIMFTIMLLPFVLFEVPVGELEDGAYTEKDFLTIGFVVVGLSTLFISFITVKHFWIWTIILFITRIGASFVEVSTESYFFKHVDKQKTDLIGFFRIARPLSFIIAPIIATIALQFIPFEYIFIIIGVMMILGTRYSLGLTENKARGMI